MCCHLRNSERVLHSGRERRTTHGNGGLTGGLVPVVFLAWHGLASVCFVCVAWRVCTPASGGGEPPDWEDFAGIVFLLLLNATIGYMEDARAGNAVATLAASLATQANVLRDGAWVTIPATELAPGDILHVKLGDIVPADVRVLGEQPALDTVNLGSATRPSLKRPAGVAAPPVVLKIDQAGLTGESMPVDKHAGALCYSGSVAKSGESPAVVVATGGRTFFGQAAGLVAVAAEDGLTVSTTLTSIGTSCVGFIAIFLTVEIIIMYTALDYGYRRGVSNALVLLIGGVPIAMPTVLSVTLALGARQLASKGAVVTSISAVEALAAVDVLVSDKTGTLTTGVLTIDVENVCLLADNVDVDQAVLLCARASRTENADAIDTAVVGCLASPAVARAGITKTHFAPFDPSTKRTAITYVDGADGATVEVSKGAPHTLLALVGADATVTAAVTKTVEAFARRGFRALGLASRMLAATGGVPDAAAP